MPGDELGRRLVPYLARAGLDPAAGPDPGAVALLLRDRVATLVEMAEAAQYFYATPHPGAQDIATHVTAANRPAFDELPRIRHLAWTREAIGAALKAAAARHGLKPPQVMMPLRLSRLRDAADAGDRRGTGVARPRGHARAARCRIAADAGP